MNRLIPLFMTAVDVFDMVYKIITISGLSCRIEFDSIIWIKQCYERVNFIFGPIADNLLLLSSLHHVVIWITIGIKRKEYLNIINIQMNSFEELKRFSFLS
jgi:hypothetical protein